MTQAVCPKVSSWGSVKKLSCCSQNYIKNQPKDTECTWRAQCGLRAFNLRSASLLFCLCCLWFWPQVFVGVKKVLQPIEVHNISRNKESSDPTWIGSFLYPSPFRFGLVQRSSHCAGSGMTSDRRWTQNIPHPNYLHTCLWSGDTPCEIFIERMCALGIQLSSRSDHWKHCPRNWSENPHGWAQIALATLWYPKSPIIRFDIHTVSAGTDPVVRIPQNPLLYKGRLWSLDVRCSLERYIGMSVLEFSPDSSLHTLVIWMQKIPSHSV